MLCLLLNISDQENMALRFGLAQTSHVTSLMSTLYLQLIVTRPLEIILSTFL